MIRQGHPAADNGKSTLKGLIPNPAIREQCPHDWRRHCRLLRRVASRRWQTSITCIAGRVRLAPPVAMTELVRAAKDFDVGFFALPGSSRHNELALPNKFFEYVTAGLAVCISELPEMARLVRGTISASR